MMTVTSSLSDRSYAWGEEKEKARTILSPGGKTYVEENIVQTRALVVTLVLSQISCGPKRDPGTQVGNHCDIRKWLCEPTYL